MNLKTPLTAIRKDGSVIHGTYAGESPDGRLLFKRPDGYVVCFHHEQVQRQDTDYGIPCDPEAYFKGEVRRVFDEFNESIGRPPTLQEFRAWLPKPWAVPLMRKMGMEVSS